MSIAKDIAQDTAQDISFHATVHADRLRFEREPRTAVHFPGTGERHSTSHTTRTHLPTPVTPNHDYADVTVTYHLATGLTGEPEHGPAPESQTDAERTEKPDTDTGGDPGRHTG